MKDMDAWIWLAIIFGGLGLVLIWAVISLWIDNFKRHRKKRSHTGSGGSATG